MASLKEVIENSKNTLLLLEIIKKFNIDLNHSVKENMSNNYTYLNYNKEFNNDLSKLVVVYKTGDRLIFGNLAISRQNTIFRMYTHLVVLFETSLSSKELHTYYKPGAILTMNDQMVTNIDLPNEEETIILGFHYL